MIKNQIGNMTIGVQMNSSEINSSHGSPIDPEPLAELRDLERLGLLMAESFS